MSAGCTSQYVTAGRTVRVMSFFLVAAAGLAVMPLASYGQEADPPPNEVPIGTFTLGGSPNGFSVVEPPAGTPVGRRDTTNDGSGRWFFQGWEKSGPNDSSEDLYSDAMAALDRGRTTDAQRLFERLIAESPDSPRAGEARQHLGRMYRNVETGAVAPSANAPADAGQWSDGKPALAKAASLNLSPVLPSAALQRARVSAAIDGQFLSDAGDRVFFSAGSADLGARARGVIQQQARFLRQRPALSVAVEGHADDGSLPSDETVRLSEARAAAVRDRLIAEGVEPARVLAYGRGREDRVSDCPAPECMAQNRRVVTILLEGSILSDLSEIKPHRRAADAGTDAGNGGLPSQ